MSIECQRTADILTEITSRGNHRVVVGFSAESENLVDNARQKMKEKQVDVMIANDISRPDIGFDADRHQVTVLTREGGVEEIGPMKKRDLADHLLTLLGTVSPASD